jgi:NAD(P)-dependent dehydrogenase (short-subunit alcohol dehydrogenase family)
VALVTGASRGLGLLIAAELAGRGCRLLLCARDGAGGVHQCGDPCTAGTTAEALIELTGGRGRTRSSTLTEMFDRGVQLRMG